MPDINRTEDRMTDAKAEEVMAHLDALASLAGTKPFSSQMKELLDTAKAQKGNIQAATSMTDKEVNESLLASTKDDYGTSYYFRGDVKNNYIRII